MNPNQFTYTITWTQKISPSQWNLQAMANNLVKIRNNAYETEAKLIEVELEKSDLKEAKTILEKIRNS
jgi:hypothetical protein